MEEESVQFIRETKRNELTYERKKHKIDEADVRRPLDKIRVSKSDAIAIVNKLKTKTSISVAELTSLQNAIVDDHSLIEVVLNTHGTLRGLVRELTGYDASKQHAACRCLCNLALGDARGCHVIAKAAGAYLITSLESLSKQLATSSAWCVGNLAGSGPRACCLLLTLGAGKLCDGIARRDVTASVLYALTHIAYVMKHDLSPEIFSKMIESLTKVDITIDSAQLLFILSCHKDFTPHCIPEDYLQSLVGKLSESLKNHMEICKRTLDSEKRFSEEVTDRSKCCELYYILRILANMNSEYLYKNLLNYFIENDLVGLMRLLLRDPSDESVWWLLGNMLNACSEHTFFQQLITD